MGSDRRPRRSGAAAGRPARRTVKPERTERRDRSPDAADAERPVPRAETGVRRASQALALLLWIPVGFAFWVPFLLRRTVAYVGAVLQAGLLGGETAGAARRWRHAVGFYRLGFERIVHAFRPDAADAPDPGPADAAPEHGVGRVLLELAWALAVWTALLWAVGVWPDAPAAIASAAAGGAETAAEVLRALGDRTRELLGR